MAKDQKDQKERDLHLEDSGPHPTPAPAPPPTPPGASGHDPTEPEKLVTSPNALPQPGAGDPPMAIGRLRDYRDNPNPDTERFARELLTRCGPLVLDGKQYRLHEGGVRAIPVEFLGAERLKHMDVDKFRIERV